MNLTLATVQVTLSATLLLGAGLFLKSFWTIRSTDLGVAADQVVAAVMRGADPRAIPPASQQEFDLYQRARDVMARHADVSDAAVSLGLPFLYNFGMSISVPGHDSIPELPGGGPYLSGVSAGYFTTAGTSLVAGRDFTPEEVAGAAPVMVVSESMADLLWSDGGALGSCVRLGSAENPCSTVVGVAEDVHRQGYREPPSLQYYVPIQASSSFGGTALVLRTRTNDAAAMARIRTALEALDPAVRYADLTLLERLLDDQIRPWRMGAWVMGLTSVLALFVSLMGVYGVLSYVVEQRRREMGVRAALGASSAGIRGLVVGRGLRAAALGVAGGAVITVASGRWTEPLLFETSVSDPAVHGMVAVLLLAAAAMACLVPANRATRVDPAICLKEE